MKSPKSPDGIEIEIGDLVHIPGHIPGSEKRKGIPIWKVVDIEEDSLKVADPADKRANPRLFSFSVGRVAGVYTKDGGRKRGN